MEMKLIPKFETLRLLLRGVELKDASAYQMYFNDYDIISQLAAVVPWPYPQNGAEEFIRNVILPQQGKSRWSWGLFLKECPWSLRPHQLRCKSA